MVPTNRLTGTQCKVIKIKLKLNQLSELSV